jgi:small subunit ribosomal protein S7
MSRKGPAQRRKIIPEPKYEDIMLARLITRLMKDGKRSVAEKIVYKALHLISERTKEDPLKIFKEALGNIKPMLEVRSRRVGGATYQVPMEVRNTRQVALGLRWLVHYSRERSEKTMQERLAGEIMDAHHNRGNAIKKREDIHRMAEANKAFSHYRW